MICRLCGSKRLYLYYNQGVDNRYRFYKCPECKLVNYDLSTGQDQMKYTGRSYVDPGDMSKKQNQDQANTYEFIKRQVKRPGRLLDIGCGNGKILVMAKADGWEVKGLELSQFLADSIHQRFGIEVVVSNFLSYEPEEANTFDLIVLRHVLEHLPDSVLAIIKIHDLLKDGGQAVMEFPDIEGWGFKVKRILNNLGLFRRKYKATYVPGHCNEFSKESFNYLLNKTGFRLLKWQNYSSKPFLNHLYRIFPFGTKARVLIQKKDAIAMNNV